MDNVTKYIAARAELIVLAVFSAGGFTPLIISGQGAPAQIAAAVLPLPEPMRAGAAVVSHAEGSLYTVLRNGSNEMVCIDETTDQTFWAHCYHKLIFAAMKRSAELEASSRKGRGHQDSASKLDGEIKAGKLNLPEHPTMGFQMRGPRSGYNPVANTVSSEIKAWQMVIIPYATGASLGLPEESKDQMPWVMGQGTWIAHIMIEH